MLTMKVVIYTSENEKLPVFAVPDEVEVTTEKIECNTAVTAEDEEAVIFTKDLMTARCNSARRHVHVIYCGDAQDLGEDLAGVRDVWPKEEGDEARAFRFHSLLAGLRAQFDAFLYDNLLEKTLETVPDMVWIKTVPGIHLKVNDFFGKVVGKTKEDCKNKDHFYIWDIDRVKYPDAAKVCEDSEKAVFEAGKTLTSEEQVRNGEGAMKQLTVYKTPVYDWYDKALGTVGIGHDVTNFSNMGIELNILSEGMPFPLLITDKNWVPVKMNNAFMEFVGRGESDQEGFCFPEWVDQHLTLVCEIRKNVEKHSLAEEYSLIRGEATGNYIIERQEILDYFGNTSGYFVTVMDMTFQRAYEREILHRANTDSLTGLFNRRYFFEYLEGIGSDVPELTLLYMDLDFFKEVNDAYGHARGDDVLKKTSDFISEIFPEHLAARLGGDEFTVLIEGEVDPEELCRNIRLLEEKVESIFRDGSIRVSISVGISRRKENQGIEAFVMDADRQMYETKKIHHR